MELPEGWKLVKLGDIADILDKFRKPLNKDERENIKGNIPYCGANGIIDYINDYIFDGEYLLVAEDGGFFKKFERSSYIFKGKFWANNHVHVLQIKKEFSLNKYVHYFLYFEDLEKYCSGATRLKLNQKMLKNLLIPIPYKDNKPDLQKQKEIVNKIETLFNNINKAIELRQKAINETKDLFNSVLNKIFKDEEFKLVKVEDALNNKAKFKIGKLKSSDYLKEGAYPIIDQGQKFIAGYHNDESLLYDGQLPIIALGDHTLNIKYIDFRFIQGADGLKILIPNKNIVYEKYLYYSLEFFKPKVIKYSRHYKIIKNLLIPIPYKDNAPDLQKQKEIAEYLDNLHNKIKKLEELQEKQLNLFKELKESILNKAFKGELV